jgi:hypothetical protein
MRDNRKGAPAEGLVRQGAHQSELSVGAGASLASVFARQCRTAYELGAAISPDKELLASQWCWAEPEPMSRLVPYLSDSLRLRHDRAVFPNVRIRGKTQVRLPTAK